MYVAHSRNLCSNRSYCRQACCRSHGSGIDNSPPVNASTHCRPRSGACGADPGCRPELVAVRGNDRCRARYHVVEAASTDEAIAILQNTDMPVDVVLLKNAKRGCMSVRSRTSESGVTISSLRLVLVSAFAS